MLFRRREKLSRWQRIRSALWPRSFRRSFTYIKRRVLRLRATPHAIAAGFAAGIFASFTPLIGFHFVMAFAIAYLVAGNMAAAALSCAVCGNPLTFPAIWGATYEVGRYVLNAETIDGTAPPGLVHALTHLDLASLWTPYLKPMLVGSLPIGIGLALLGYGFIFMAARSFQRRRAGLVLAKAQARAASAAIGERP